LARLRIPFRLLLTLERTILLELLSNLVLIFCVTTGIFFVGALIQFLNQASEVGLDILIAVLPHLLPGLAALTIPTSLLLATIMTYGRMSEDNEITALRASGVPLYPIVLPSLFLGMMLSSVCLALNVEIIPRSNHRQRLAAKDLLGRFRNILESARENSYSFEDHRLSWTRIDEDGALRNLTMDLAQDEGVTRWDASRARIETDPTETHIAFDLEDVQYRRYDLAGNSVDTGRAETLRMVFRTEELLGTVGRMKPKELSLVEVVYAIRRRGMNRIDVNELTEELHERFVLSFAPFVLALLGAALGILARRGALVQSMLLAFLVAFVPYYGLVMVGRALIESGDVPAAIALWPANGIMAVLGVVLLRKAVRR
jgi:lipopolysaccharide export LptBFGC system permease protein LptF